MNTVRMNRDFEASAEIRGRLSQLIEAIGAEVVLWYAADLADLQVLALAKTLDVELDDPSLLETKADAQKARARAEEAVAAAVEFRAALNGIPPAVHRDSEGKGTRILSPFPGTRWCGCTNPRCADDVGEFIRERDWPEEAEFSGPYVYLSRIPDRGVEDPSILRWVRFRVYLEDLPDCVLQDIGLC